MKHNKKVNPLTHFNNLKASAIKKAGGEMERMDALMKEGARSSMDAISKVPQYGYGQNNAAMATMAAGRMHKKGGSVKRKRK